MRLMVWRGGDAKADWQSYGWKVVAFSDRPSSCILEIAKDLTAHAGKDIDPVAANAISQDTYVEDGATGGDEKTAKRLIGEMTLNQDSSLTYLSCILEIAKDLTAHAGKDINPVAANAISQDTYVDDGAMGGDKKTAKRLIGETTLNQDGSQTYSWTLSQVFQKRGF